MLPYMYKLYFSLETTVLGYPIHNYWQPSAAFENRLNILRNLSQLYSRIIASSSDTQVIQRKKAQLHAFHFAKVGSYMKY